MVSQCKQWLRIVQTTFIRWYNIWYHTWRASWSKIFAIQFGKPCEICFIFPSLKSMVTIISISFIVRLKGIKSIPTSTPLSYYITYKEYEAAWRTGDLSPRLKMYNMNINLPSNYKPGLWFICSQYQTIHFTEKNLSKQHFLPCDQKCLFQLMLLHEAF